jgi:hypothetical protein
MAEAMGDWRPLKRTGIDNRPTGTTPTGTGSIDRAAGTRGPVHLAVFVGLTAGAYSAALAGVTALQSAADRELASSNAPAADALTMLTVEHDRLETRLSAAGSTYGTTAAAYSEITAQLTRLEAELGKLATQVKKVEGTASWVPPVVRMPSVSSSVPRAARPASRPASNGSTGASGH